MNKVLSNDEMDALCTRIAKPTYGFMRKLLLRELDYLKTRTDRFDINEIMHVMVISLSSVDANFLILARDIFKDAMGKEVDLGTLLNAWGEEVSIAMNQDQSERIKKKMN